MQVPNQSLLCSIAINISVIEHLATRRFVASASTKWNRRTDRSGDLAACLLEDVQQFFVSCFACLECGYTVQNKVKVALLPRTARRAKRTSRRSIDCTDVTCSFHTQALICTRDLKRIRETTARQLTAQTY